jgi:hypothetical protein
MRYTEYTHDQSLEQAISADNGDNGRQNVSHTLEVMAASLAALRPTFATFYGLLDDEQKARLVAMTMSNNPEAQPAQIRRPIGKQDIAHKRSDSKQDSLCQQWVINLRSWPIRQIEDGASLSDEQHATLYELTAAIYRAAGDWGRFVTPTIASLRQLALKPEKAN